MSIEVPKPQEIIFLNIGQSGCCIGNSFWELFNAEHKIENTGFSRNNLNRGDLSIKTVYDEVGCNKYVPRCIFVDLEPSIIDEIKTGPFRTLYHPLQLVNGLMDASNNYGRGHNLLGVKILDKVMEQVRKQVEMCSGLQGFFLTHSLGGGTGSGLSTLLIETLSAQYSKVYKFEMFSFPAPNLSELMVEPYNAMLGAACSIPHIDLGFIMDNEALWDICCNKFNIIRPTFSNINRLVSQAASGITAPLRFKGELQGDMIEFQTNLVPYPRLHFPLISFSPLVTKDYVVYDQVNTVDIAQDLFRQDHSFIKCDMSKGRYMCACVMFRGQVNLNETRLALNKIRQRIQFVNWCPTGLKLDINSCQSPTFISGSDMAQPLALRRSCTMAANHTSVRDAWGRVIKKFNHLYKKRAFLHWFVAEKVEETEFDLSKEEMMHMMTDYLEAANDS